LNTKHERWQSGRRRFTDKKKYEDKFGGEDQCGGLMGSFPAQLPPTLLPFDAGNSRTKVVPILFGKCSMSTKKLHFPDDRITEAFPDS
jgi:hypothetical protein